MFATRHHHVRAVSSDVWSVSVQETNVTIGTISRFATSLRATGTGGSCQPSDHDTFAEAMTALITTHPSLAPAGDVNASPHERHTP